MRPDVSTGASTDFGSQLMTHAQILSGVIRKKITPKRNTEPAMITVPRFPNSPAAAPTKPLAAVVPHDSA